jgi:hypothetical protein
MLNEDYRDILQALADEKVRFFLVGAYALAAHGYPRATNNETVIEVPKIQRALGLSRETFVSRPPGG